MSPHPFDVLARLYYTDEGEHELEKNAARLECAFRRAAPSLPEWLRRGLLHDMYLTHLEYSADSRGTLSLLLHNARSNVSLCFTELTRLEFHGNFASEAGQFPYDLDLPKPLAQLLDFWCDGTQKLECAILLDSERYILLTAKGVHGAANPSF